MAIYHANITLERDNYCVHLQDEDELFFLVPSENDGSDNWKRLQAWLDEGNKVVDDMSNQDTHYIAQRRNEYPSIVDQLDKIYHNGIDSWKAEIKAVKDKYPKGSE
tara:strand:- start:5 stop:322 length:318 start_codon:yes stop_codon:yes gene_type:complete